ncbi:MAG: magnesium chelatase subunit H [Candidatus Odinarchaeota archaeon]|nr:magnesium chelatase subunit H [Candidatus Odinarchaeota archaeon]
MDRQPLIVLIGYQFKPAMASAIRKIKEEYGEIFSFKFYRPYDIDREVINIEKFVNEIRTADIVLIDVRGGDIVTKLLTENLKDTKNTVICLIGGSDQLFRLTRMGSFSFSSFEKMKKIPIIGKLFRKERKIDYGKILQMRERFEKIGRRLPIGILKHAKNYVYLSKYYDNPCEENYYNMFILLLREYAGMKILKEPQPPIVMPSMGIIDVKTGKIYQSTDDYLRDYDLRDAPLVGILCYGGYHYDHTYPAVEALAKKLEEKGIGVIPVFSADLRYYLAIERFFLNGGKPIIDAMIDLLWFRFAGGPLGGDHEKTFDVLKRLNVPVLHGILLSEKTIDRWKKDRDGISPIVTITTVILPELDGRFEPIVSVGPVLAEKTVSGDIQEFIAVEDRIEKIANRVEKWINLRRKKNSEKKIAIILYNYPPGEANIGKAAYLDTFKSLSNILNYLKGLGYTIPQEYSPQELKELVLSSGLVNSGDWILTQDTIAKLPKVSLEEYRNWFKELPKPAQEKIINTWGEPPGNIMAIGDMIILPIIKLGNVFIGIQPSRGVHEDPSKVYHSRDLPPHHQYVAFYKWLEKKANVDAVIHLGTHGTLEFLPGKEVGLSSECYPDILIGNLSNIYLYHVVNASESSIAKRRSYAFIINHASPPTMVSGLSEELIEIERLLDQYFEILQYDKQKASELEKKIVEKAKVFNLGNSADEIHDKLVEYKRTLVPEGLHTFGEKIDDQKIVDILLHISRYDRGNIKSLFRIFAEKRGLEYFDLLKNPSKMSSQGVRYGKIIEKIENEARDWIYTFVIKENVPDEREQDLLAVRDFLIHVKKNIKESKELENLGRALNGEYILPGPGGDIIRNPNVFPTGRNTYQLDPTTVPNDIALERGRKIAEDYINTFFKQNGRYPRTVNLVLWAFETMKTGGETIAAIFHLLGVKPVWKGPYVRDIEVIPLEELKRPRIDVVVTICGIFRDTFYNLVELLDQAIRKVSELDEPDDMNYVRSNNKQLKEKIGEERIYRIFGPPEGEYATSLTALIESSNWTTEQDIVREYLNSMRYAYGRTYRNVKAEETFKEILKSVDLVTQVRDTVEYEITDLDHYYEFLGGVTRTVKELKGEKPQVLVADTTKEFIVVEKSTEAIKRGVITRLANPKWLDSMLKHDFSGAEKIATRVENLLGLASTLNEVENWMWNEVANKIVFDEERYNKLIKANRWAAQKVIKKLLEANSRGYWQTDEETLKRLKEKYIELESILEEEI